MGISVRCDLPTICVLRAQVLSDSKDAYTDAEWVPQFVSGLLARLVTPTPSLPSSLFLRL